jgi:mannosyltransferase OCH1-like enzyme/Flp pilus assembly protein TadD
MGSRRKQRRNRQVDKTPSLQSAELKTLKDNAEIQSLVDLAMAAQNDGRFDEANSYLEKAKSISPSDGRVHAALGYIASHQGNLLKAFQHYSIVEKVTVATEQLLIALASLFGKVGKYEGALPYLRRAAERAEAAADKRNLPEQDQHDLLELALVLLHLGKPEAIESVRRIFAVHTPHLAAALEPGLETLTAADSPVLAVLESIHQAAPAHEFFPALRANWLASFGRDEEAQVLLEETVQGDPTHWRAWGMLGELAHADQSYDEAAAFIREALRHCPYPDHLYASLIRNRIQNAAFQEASNAIEEGAALSKHPEKLRCLHVTLLEAQGKPATALAFAKQLAEQFPHSLDVLLALAESLTSHGYSADALQVLLKLVSLSPEHQQLGKQSANWYAAQYKFQDAIQVLEKLLIARPGDAEIMGQLMMMRILDGDIAGAVAMDRAIDDQLEIRGREKSRLHYRHSFQRRFLREFNTNAWAIDAMGQARSLPPSLQVPRLLRELEKEPHYAGFAAGILIRLRQAGAIRTIRSKENASIPKRVSQYWDSTKPPDDVLSLMSSWQLEAYDYQCYDDQSAWDFIKQHNDDRVLRAFESAAHPTLRADLIRLAVLSVKGGIWGDADDRCCGALETITTPGCDLVLVQENFGTIGNNFLAAAPNHTFIRFALNEVTKNILERDGDSIWFISGPGAITLAFCHFYQHELRQLSVPEGVRMIDTFTLSNTVAQHLPLAYKHQGRHWRHRDQRQRSLFRKPSGRPLRA